MSAVVGGAFVAVVVVKEEESHSIKGLAMMMVPVNLAAPLTNSKAVERLEELAIRTLTKVCVFVGDGCPT